MDFDDDQGQLLVENKRGSVPRSWYAGGVSSASEGSFEGEPNANTGVEFLVQDGVVESRAKFVGFETPVLLAVI